MKLTFFHSVVTAALILAAGAWAADHDAPPIYMSPDSTGGTVGVCILLDTTGHVSDVRVIVPSGDPLLDKSIIGYAKALHWNKPYPHPGWMGINIAIGGGSSNAPLPDCSNLSKKAPVS